ncbi:Iron(III) transport system permease protein OS=Castellaniella defragrans OX=75697 GN=HNR28_000886 PE=3 SV=1 [Castellaniella defragrans]
MRMRHGSRLLLPLYLVGAATLVLIVYPVLRILPELFMTHDGEMSLSSFSNTLALPQLPSTIISTVVVVAASVVIALFLGVTFAWLNERTDARLGWIATIMPIIPILAPPITVDIGWVFLLSPSAGYVNVLLRNLLGSGHYQGPLNIFSWPGIIWLYSAELTPVVYLVVASTLRNLDSGLEQAGRVAGASPLHVFLHITVPAIKVHLASAAWLAFTIGLALFSAPSIIGARAHIDVLTTRIVRLFTAEFPPRTDIATVLGLFILLMILAGWMALRAIVRSSHGFVIGGKHSQSVPLQLGRWRRPLKAVMLLFVILALFLPVVSLLLVSVEPFWSAHVNVGTLTFDAYRQIMDQASFDLKAIVNSVRISAISALVVIVVAFGVSNLAHWIAPGRLSTLLNESLKLPAGFSHVIVTIGIILVFFGPPFHLGNTLLIIGLAYFVLYLPQGTVAANGSLRLVGPELIEAARVCGASAGKTLTTVLYPICRGGLVNGWVLVFLYMIGDLTASVLLSGTDTPTIGYILLQDYDNGTYPTVAALAVMIAGVSSIVVVATLFWANARRRM